MEEKFNICMPLLPLRACLSPHVSKLEKTQGSGSYFVTLVKSFNIVWETNTTDDFLISLPPVFTAHDSLPLGQKVVNMPLSVTQANCLTN